MLNKHSSIENNIWIAICICCISFWFNKLWLLYVRLLVCCFSPCAYIPLCFKWGEFILMSDASGEIQVLFWCKPPTLQSALPEKYRTFCSSELFGLFPGILSLDPREKRPTPPCPNPLLRKPQRSMVLRMKGTQWPLNTWPGRGACTNPGKVSGAGLGRGEGARHRVAVELPARPRVAVLAVAAATEPFVPAGSAGGDWRCLLPSTCNVFPLCQCLSPGRENQYPG